MTVIQLIGHLPVKYLILSQNLKKYIFEGALIQVSQ